MTVQEAYKAFKSAKNGLVVMSCYEYPSYFVFNAVRPEFATPEKAAQAFDGLFSVNKTDGGIASFRPLDLPLDERRRGKRIPIYDA